MYLKLLDRNALLEAVKAAGVDPREYEPFMDDERVRFGDRSTGSHFEVHSSPVGRVIDLKVGDGTRGTRPSGLIKEIVSSLETWLEMVEEFRTTPDLWAELERDDALFKATADDADNAPFEQADKDAVRREIQEIKATAKDAYELNDHALRQLQAALDDVGEKLDTMGRREWITYAAGTLAMLQATVLPPDEPRQLLLRLVRAAVNAFGHRLGLPPQ